MTLPSSTTKCFANSESVSVQVQWDITDKYFYIFIIYQLKIRGLEIKKEMTLPSSTTKCFANSESVSVQVQGDINDKYF